MTTIYYKLSPQDIFDNIINTITKEKKVTIKGMQLYIHPHVYPSDRFRSTQFLLKNIGPLTVGATVCDMGCGMGVVGLYALKQGARKIVQVDINSFAVENAKANRALHEVPDDALEIIQSNCFDKVPKQSFDLIIFNIPFHSDPCEINDPLNYAFHDPNFTSTQKFLDQSQNYSNEKTKIIIAFSNKGNVPFLEKIFEDSGFKWQLWKVSNTDQKYDNRLYLLHK